MTIGTPLRWAWWAVAALTVLLVAAFAYGVWPTPYRYDRWLGRFPVRIHRFTGDAEFLGRTGWLPMRPAAPALGPLLREFRRERQPDGQDETMARDTGPLPPSVHR